MFNDQIPNVVVVASIKPSLLMFPNAPQAENRHAPIKSLYDSRRNSHSTPSHKQPFPKDFTPIRNACCYEDSFDSFTKTPQKLVAPIVTSHPKTKQISIKPSIVPNFEKPPEQASEPKKIISKYKNIDPKIQKLISGQPRLSYDSRKTKYGYIQQSTKLMEFPELGSKISKKAKFTYDKIRAKTAGKARRLVGFSTTKYQKNMHPQSITSRNSPIRTKTQPEPIQRAQSVSKIRSAKISGFIDVRNTPMQNIPNGIREFKSKSGFFGKKRQISTAESSPNLLKGQLGTAILLNTLNNKDSLKNIKKTFTSEISKRSFNLSTRMQIWKNKTNNSAKILPNGYYAYNYTTYANLQKKHNVAHFPLCEILSENERKSPKSFRKSPRNENKTKSLLEFRNTIMSKTYDSYKINMNNSPRIMEPINEIKNLAKSRIEKIENFVKAKPYMNRLKKCNKSLERLARIKLKKNTDFLAPGFSEKVESLISK